ncbi:IS110 family transposase [Psychromonas sp. MME2]|uniref:IS110 family transposase n=1 Tax=unclassified Psychromonas TaxID=2614957 RepID=UPI00339C21AF
MNTSVISIDLAKNVFQVCALNQAHKVISNKKVKRDLLLDVLRQYKATHVVMEAYYSANFWGREIAKLGHTVNLIPAIKVKPFVQGNKNDANDALAIAEASFRPNIKFVKPKSLEQQDMQCLQRIRERHVKQRTAICNQIRGFLADYGIIIGKNIVKLRAELPEILEDATQPLTVISRQFLQQLHHEVKGKDLAVNEIEIQLQALLADNPHYKRAQQVPGIGPIIAAGTIAAIGNGKQFKNGRQFAAWIGVTPRQHASGDNSYMSGITKRGNRQLRTLFIHGARALMNWCHKHNDSFNLWIQSFMETKPTCKVIVAVANKLARMTWAVIAKEQDFKLPSYTI